MEGGSNLTIPTTPFSVLFHVKLRLKLVAPENMYARSALFPTAHFPMSELNAWASENICWKPVKWPVTTFSTDHFEMSTLKTERKKEEVGRCTLLVYMT